MKHSHPKLSLAAAPLWYHCKQPRSLSWLPDLIASLKIPFSAVCSERRELPTQQQQSENPPPRKPLALGEHLQDCLQRKQDSAVVLAAAPSFSCCKHKKPVPVNISHWK